VHSTCGVYGVAVRCTTVVVFMAPVGHLPHTPSSSGARQPLPQLALCVLIVVTCLTVKVDRAERVRSVRSSGSVHVRCCVCGVSWSAPTHSEQFRCASVIVRAWLIVASQFVCYYLCGKWVPIFETRFTHLQKISGNKFKISCSKQKNRKTAIYSFILEDFGQLKPHLPLILFTIMFHVVFHTQFLKQDGSLFVLK